MEGTLQSKYPSQRFTKISKSCLLKAFSCLYVVSLLRKTCSTSTPGSKLDKLRGGS